MGYSKKVTQLAWAELERRRQAAQAAAAEALARFNAMCPRAEEVKYQMARNAAEAARAVLTGADARSLLEKRREQGLRLSEEYQRLLSQHGLSRKDIQPQYACPMCQDTGFIDGKMCQCYKNLRKTIAYSQLSSQLPLEQCTFDSFSLDFYSEAVLPHMRKVLSACQTYAQRLRQNSPSMLFWGGTGLGKTHLSLAIANTAVEKGMGVVYGTAQSFASALERERFARDIQEGFGTEEGLKDCDLLIIDDLGTELSSSYVSAALYDVLNARMMAQRPTIISTNLGPAAIEERYSQRLASRIAGYYGKLEFKGKDIRVASRFGRQQP